MDKAKGRVRSWPVWVSDPYFSGRWLSVGEDGEEASKGLQAALWQDPIAVLETWRAVDELEGK